MTPLLQLGTARVDVTPRHAVPLAGFAHRTGAFEDIHSRLFLRALLFSDGHPGSRALLISADLFCWGPDLARRVRESIAQRLGISAEAIILHATHNHSGPQTSRLFSPSLGTPDERYLDFLGDAAMHAARAAMDNLEPVTVECGAGTCRIGMNRRRNDGGVIRMAPNPEGATDPAVTVVRFRARDDAPKALLVHFTCHPTTSGANQVCAEFPGLAMAALEEDSALVAAYLQGCCGDVRPALIRGGEFYRGGSADAAALGAGLAGEVRRVLAGEMAPCASCNLAFRHRAAPLPLAETGCLTLESTRLDLAHGFGLLSFNAEMAGAYGLYVKEFSQGALLPCGYSNGMIGYVCTRRQIEEGGYEPAEAFRYYGLPAPFSTNVEGAVLDHIRQLAPSALSAY